MTTITKEGVANILFFLAALIVLLFNTFGLLTIPGIIIALVCMFLVYKKQQPIVAALAVLTGLGSFIAQSVMAFCPYCTIAATLFIFGGLCSLIIKPPKTWISATLLVLSLASIFLLANLIPDYVQSPIITQPVNIAQAANDKPKLYLSPDCGACKEVVQQFIDSDPKGENWQPVIIPTISLARGEHYLREKGYIGEVISAPESPTKFVPVLQIKDQLYKGKEIHFNKLVKESFDE